MQLRTTIGCLLLAAGASVGIAAAEVASDKPAAIVVFPKLQVSASASARVDTLIELSNTSRTEPALAHCFYLDAGSHCSTTGAPCRRSAECGGGSCVAGWTETDFQVHLTARQPLAWVITDGLGSMQHPVPIDGRHRNGPPDPTDPNHKPQTNAGTLVPAVGTPFTGELKCVVVGRDDRPAEKNVLVGRATITRIDADGGLDVEVYNAIGVQAIVGTNNGDGRLQLGGDGAEYEGCPNTLIVNHFFDFAVDPVHPDSHITSALTLVPCSEDLISGDTRFGATGATILVYNEFEQRLSTSIVVDCLLESQLSLLDTTQPQRSAFSVGTGGTLVGQMRIRPTTHGLLAVLSEHHTAKSGHVASAMVNVDQQGRRGTDDEIRFR